MGHVTWPRPFQGRFVIHRLGLTMFNPHTKFEMTTFTCNDDMKGNAKCRKNLVLSHPLRDLGVTHSVHLLLDEKRIVDFLLEIIELFSLALTAAALSVKISVF